MMLSHNKIALHVGGGLSSRGWGFSAMFHADEKKVNTRFSLILRTIASFASIKQSFPFSSTGDKIAASTVRPRFALLSLPKRWAKQKRHHANRRTPPVPGIRPASAAAPGQLG